MGLNSSVPVPTPDVRTLRAMELGHLNMKELQIFWLAFRKIDKKLQGTIELGAFYKFLEEKRSIFGDAMFELIDCRNSGRIDFGEFVHAVVTYSLFEREEVLKFCFFIFDKDKNGYVEQEELNWMVNILHGLGPQDELRGNEKAALAKLQEEYHEDGKVDFKEFGEFNKLFPALFYPAYRLQVNMVSKIGGPSFWARKKRWLQDEKDQKRALAEYHKRKEMRRLMRMQRRKVRRKMGFVRYFCCFFERHKYRSLFPIDFGDDEESKEDIDESRRKERDLARLQADQNIKNPETAEFKAYMARKKAKEAERLDQAKRDRIARKLQAGAKGAAQLGNGSPGDESNPQFARARLRTNADSRRENRERRRFVKRREATLE